MKLDNSEQDRSQSVNVLGVEIVPDLTVAIEHATAIDIDIFASELEEGRCILEDLGEAVGLPVVRVICELDVALDGWTRWSEKIIFPRTGRYALAYVDVS